LSWLDGVAARLKLLFSRRRSESRMEHELQFHVEMETERLIRDHGLDAEEARRRALVAFGGVQQHRETMREGRGSAWAAGISLDFKLGLRMLAKYPGLTLVGVLGISVAVIVGTVAFTVVRAVTNTRLPLDEGDRVVAIRNVDARTNRDASRTHLHDLAVWREALPAVEELGAFRSTSRNLIAPDVPAEAVSIAEMSASGFRVARVAAIRGRTLSDDDALEGAPAVVVIAYDIWQQRFGGRADIVGSTVQLGTVRHTVVGVMPKGFAFPANHQAWTPLQLSASAYKAGEAPAIIVFGRLAPGASLAEARSQLTTIGQRLSATYPSTHEHIRSRVFPYAQIFIDGTGLSTSPWGRLLHLGQVVVSLLLVVIATNVGVLVYARTASRSGEMAVRTALGASRRRVVAQLFAEALVLSAVASLVGIVVAHFVFRRIDALVQQSLANQLPFWIRLQVTPAVVAYVAGLAVLAAVIIGVIPGLKATRQRLSDRLRDLSGGSSMQLGRTWTALLIAQVAVSVAALPIALGGGAEWVRLVALDLGTPVTESFVIATPVLDLDRDARSDARATVAERRARYANVVAELTRKLGAEPGGFEVVLMSARPGAEDDTELDIDRPSSMPSHDTSAAGRPRRSAGIGYVDANFLDAFSVRTLAGRRFVAADFAPGANALIVNQAFVKYFLGDGNPLGRRVRPAAREGATSAEPWWEIVGVVEDFPGPPDRAALRLKAYRPLQPNAVYPMTLGVRARTLTTPSTVRQIRDVAMSVDPALRFTVIRTLEDAMSDEIKVERLGVFWIVMVTLSTVLLSAAGIYALMSFTVARRRREIGIRAALGARSGRVVAEILTRAVRQLAIGVGIGFAGTLALGPLVGDSSPLLQRLVQLLVVVAVMMIVGLIAAIGPARRALRVQPTEALRSE
jgi:putative ABC transport system permease protein